MMATLRTLQMKLAYDDEHEQPIDEVFDKEKQQCLQIMNEGVRGADGKIKKSIESKHVKMGYLED